ncbi:MAG TPA: dipeptide epimerase [Candidatus Stackebrandtia faecavium]|nr:dipeptide epimerase [Candidatus Stackebrandtia faecavium]
MSIREVSAAVATASLHTEFVTALRRTSHAETVIATVTDDSGHTGRGEAPQTWRITGQSLAGGQACINGPLRDALIGKDPTDLNAVLNEVEAAVVANSASKAAIDVALHDLAAQRLGVSLTQLLGGSDKTVPTVVTLPAGEIEALTKAATQRVSEGFTALKVKVGLDPDSDVARLAAIRDAIGKDISLRLDANQGWTPKQSIRIIRQLEDADLGIELIEQPTPAHDLDGLAQVTASVDTTIMADESVHDVRDLSAVIERNAADAVNIKLAKCGGLRTARTMLDMASKHDLGTSIGSMMEGRIGVAAAASLAAAYPLTSIADLDAAWWLSSTDPAMKYDHGALTLASDRGLAAIEFPPAQ